MNTHNGVAHALPQPHRPVNKYHALNNDESVTGINVVMDTVFVRTGARWMATRNQSRNHFIE